MRNPYENIKRIRTASKYLTNKHGIIKDVLKAFKSLPTLNYHLAWSSYEDLELIMEFEKEIYDFLDSINVKKFVRDALYEVGEMGTVVSCLRNGKYVQFLELDDLRINRQENGKWVVEYDLASIKKTLPSNASANDIAIVIESLPDEVTKSAYLNYQRTKDDSARYVRISNCEVLGLDNNRNMPYGFPLSMGAWTSLIQKEIIARVERSQADQLTKKILILYAGNIGGKDSNKPAPKPLIEGYFKEVSKLLVKKGQSNNSSSNDTSGTAVMALPDFFKLESLDVEVEMFTKDLYDKINSDVFMNLGVSEALIYGSGANFSAATMNSEKFFRTIFTVLEDIETIINSYIEEKLQNDISCKFYFDRTTMLDKDKYIDKCYTFYQQTGIFSPWAEALLGVPYHYALGMAKYENEVLKIHEFIKPPLNAHTMPSNSGGRPEGDAINDGNTKSKSYGGNNNPSPSD